MLFSPQGAPTAPEPSAAASRKPPSNRSRYPAPRDIASRNEDDPQARLAGHTRGGDHVLGRALGGQPAKNKEPPAEVKDKRDEGQQRKANPNCWRRDGDDACGDADPRVERVRELPPRPYPGGLD
ncbi:MAG TPA: hypothetical protein VGM91_12975 [Conexibacter sp.]